MIVKIAEEKRKVESPGDMAKIMQAVLKSEHENDQMKEHFWAIGLNTRNVIEYVELVSLGILNASLVHPREVFRLAVMKRIDTLIIVHNHPSGNCEASEADLLITEKLRKAGKILSIEVIDHIIISEKSFMSFKEKHL